MIGPVCDYFTEAETFSEAVREMRVHAETHNEWSVSNDDVDEIERIFMEKKGGVVS